MKNKNKKDNSKNKNMRKRKKKENNRRRRRRRRRRREGYCLLLKTYTVLLCPEINGKTETGRVSIQTNESSKSVIKFGFL